MMTNSVNAVNTVKTVAFITVFLLGAGLLVQGCGGGGGGASLPAAVKETGTLSGIIALPGGVDPSGALVVATKMNEDGTQPASAASPKAGGQVEPKANDETTYFTITAADGSYTFTDIEKGSYFVVATKGAYRASGTATVETKAATVVDLSLTPTGSIHGQVLVSGPDASSASMSGTLAILKGTSYIAATDELGYYTLSQVPIGSYELMFSRPGYEVLEYGTMATVLAGGTTQLETRTLVVDSGRVGNLYGTVLRPEPAGGGQVTHDGILVSVLGTQYMGTTGYDGNWRIENIPAGVYSLAFGDLDAGVEDNHLIMNNIEVEAGTDIGILGFTLQETGISGTITVSGGDPAVGAIVQIQDMGNEGFALTRTDGTYEIIGLSPDTYTVAVVMTGYTTAVEENVMVEQGQMTDVSLQLAPSTVQAGTGVIEGTVMVDGPADGGVSPNAMVQFPLEYAAVELLGTNLIAITDSQGQYRMTGVPEGMYDLYVDGDEDGLEQEVTIPGVEILSGQTTTKDVVLNDSEPPVTWGDPGIIDLDEVELSSGGTALRVFFEKRRDVSEPIVYNLYVAPAASWDFGTWSNNTVMPVPESAAGVPVDRTGELYIDVPDLVPGTEYAFGLRAQDGWGNEDMNFMNALFTPTGGQDIFAPRWLDESRVGIQAALPLDDRPGVVAVEFESAVDDRDDGQSTHPVVYLVYSAGVNEFDEANWSNNVVMRVAEDQVHTGSYYQNRVLVEHLIPGTAYLFGVRAADSAVPANVDMNTEIKAAVPAGGQAGAAHHLEFGRAPGTVINGQEWPGFGVAVMDETGIIVSDAADTVTMGLDSASNPSGLTGALQRAAGAQDPSGTVIPGVAVYYDVAYSTALENLPETIVVEAAAPGLIGASVEIPVQFLDSDGDGVPDAVDSFPYDATSASPPAATDTGDIGLNLSGAPGASLSNVTAVTADSVQNQTGRPVDSAFPDGVVSFEVTDIEPGGTVQVEITFPTAIPEGTSYYKVDQNGFHEFPGAVINGNTVTLTLTDGGAGDADGVADGVIRDPGGWIDPALLFAASGLETAVRNAIGKASGPVMLSEAVTVTTLDAGEMTITDLSGIEHLHGLSTLSLDRNTIGDISALAGLTPTTGYDVTALAMNIQYSSDPTDQIRVTTLAPAPKIVSFVADDPDDGDAVPSIGDTMTVTFDMAVNMQAGATSTKTGIDEIFSFSCIPGASYSGVWSQDSTSVTITIDDATGAACTIGQSIVSVKASAGLKSNDNTSAASTAVSPPLTGNWGMPN